MNSSIRLVYKSCRNDGISALKFKEITVFVLCLLIILGQKLLGQPSYNVGIPQQHQILAESFKGPAGIALPRR